MNVCMFLKINAKYETIEKTPAYYEHSISWYIVPVVSKEGKITCETKHTERKYHGPTWVIKAAIKAAVFSR